MFADDKKKQKGSPAPSPDRLNRIVEGTEIIGEIRSGSNIRIDGKVKGTINTKGRLVVGANGFIEGEVQCQFADIEGTITGKLGVSELLTLKTSAKINGDINTKKLAIEPGAAFNGNCIMGGGVIKEMQNPSSQNGQANNPSVLAKAR